MWKTGFWDDMHKNDHKYLKNVQNQKWTSKQTQDKIEKMLSQTNQTKDGRKPHKEE